MSPQLPCLQGVKQWQTMFALTSGQAKTHKFVQCYSGVNIEYKTKTQLMCVSSPAAAIFRYILCSFVEYVLKEEVGQKIVYPFVVYNSHLSSSPLFKEGGASNCAALYAI